MSRRQNKNKRIKRYREKHKRSLYIRVEIDYTYVSKTLIMVRQAYLYNY